MSSSSYDLKAAYQYAPIGVSYGTRGERSDSTGSTASNDSYSSVASSDSEYEKLAPRSSEVAYYREKPLPATPQRRVRFLLEKDAPSLPSSEGRKKPRKMSSRDGAYAWFAQRRYQTNDERLDDSMERVL